MFISRYCEVGCAFTLGVAEWHPKIVRFILIYLITKRFDTTSLFVWIA
ncbi:hypothetical protein T190115A13A_130099 [Tenacibaculum sp. 190524A02b]|uniref:Uncharacterized protein n=1 Tax=Tenacibaculum vairaonense TaxID=3137860 RepID=A0ABM9PHZ7_9FLAO